MLLIITQHRLPTCEGRFAQLFEVANSNDPGPSVDFLQWWFLAAKRYPVPASPYHQLPADDIPVDATQRQFAPHPERPVVPDVPDNIRLARRMLVGTRTMSRDWQWLDEIMVDDAHAVQPAQRIRHMPEGRGRRRGGRDGGGRGEGGDTAPTQKIQGVASTSHAHHARTSTHAWLDRLSSPGLQQMIDEILMPCDDSYRPKFDGTQFDSQVHFDLNEPVSGPSQAFMALGGTPPSAHLPGESWEVPFMAPAAVPTPAALPAPAEQPD
ncbi:hypothetical protein PIB30_017223 [Stylosanthes scabra]|uniref:Uncharacterized protein n=1 Tax=Stylosanthes scabra TaxID=79078 RepID=A0ABU6Y6L4_9FABA|nr:hypothetical protein [Stylosanthes scabra]